VGTFVGTPAGDSAPHGNGRPFASRSDPLHCGVVAVISIAMLSGGAARAAYYVERSAECRPTGYYLDAAERPGRWRGRGAAALGLDGPVTGEQGAIFAGLLEGRLPDGTQVAGPVLRRDPNGPPDARVDIRRCGIDLVVSAPKSVSVLYALADPTTSAAVVAAHEAAVDQAFAYLERHAGHGLRGHQGDGKRAARVDTDGIVAAAFTHQTSRAEDPQLHTHLVAANLLHGVDGKWSAIDSRAMYLHARTAGCVYQAALRGELTRTLGVGWGPVRRGVAEITGIGKPLRKEFSTRRQDIEDELERTGTSGRKAAQRAAYVTRPAKTHTPATSLRAEWAAGDGPGGGGAVRPGRVD
jgi:conjugative relaxase-like TrwC/TraI family protein